MAKKPAENRSERHPRCRISPNKLDSFLALRRSRWSLDLRRTRTRSGLLTVGQSGRGKLILGWRPFFLMCCAIGSLLLLLIQRHRRVHLVHFSVGSIVVSHRSTIVIERMGDGDWMGCGVRIGRGNRIGCGNWNRRRRLGLNWAKTVVQEMATKRHHCSYISPCFSLSYPDGPDPPDQRREPNYNNGDDSRYGEIGGIRGRWRVSSGRYSGLR